MIWKKDDIDKESVKELAETFGIDTLAAAIFWRRNIIDGESIKFFLEDDLIFTHSPFLFNEMEDAVERLSLAVEEKEKIRIFGDRDVDGITSTVLLYQALKDAGAEVSWSVPLGDDPYGLTRKGVEEFAAENGTLIITVDCGISNNDEIAYARECGIDTLIVDHHIPPETLPPACAIINPKLEESGYPFKDLAGCGVTAKLIWAFMFSRTDFYNAAFCLVNARPGNDSVIIEAVKIVNMVETDRILENLVPGIVQIDQTRFFKFIEGLELYVYESELQKKLLRQVFGPRVDIHLADLSSGIHEHFPVFRGKSLYSMLGKSRFARYSREKTTELDIFINLLKHYIMSREKGITEKYTQLLDLVAIGTLADMMPLKDENRILVKKGMEIVNSTERKGLREIFVLQNILAKKINTSDVGWQISPLINATGRLGRPDIAVKLFLTEDNQERKSLAEEVIELNRTRKKQGELAWSRILPQAKKSHEQMKGNLVLVEDKAIQRGITGVIASRLVSMFDAPALVIASLDGKRIGSARSPGTCNVRELLSQFEDLFIDYGGHNFAAGFSLEEKNAETFIQRLSTHVMEMTATEKQEQVLTVDAELPPDFMTPSLVELVERFEPYGEDSPPLVFLVRNIKICEIDLVGKKDIQHVKMLLEYGKYKWPALFWNASDQVNRTFSLGDHVDIVFRLNRNYYLNKENLQLTILDLRRT